MQNLYVNFEVPSSWNELSDKQLRYVYRLIDADLYVDEIKLLCLLQWSDTKVIGKQNSDSFLLKKNKSFFEVDSNSIAEILSHMDWLEKIADYPVRLSKINGRKAISADFQDVPFESYIVVDNLYQGYLETLSDELLDDMTEVLYGHKLKLSPAQRISVFYWIASLKDFLAKKFSNFLQHIANDESQNLLGSQVISNAQRIQDSMNSMIRALTKGDITKEEQILSMDTWRALTELDAQAREYQELKKQTYGSK